MDKIDKLLDAIEHPERYSDTEIEAMLADSEVRDVYEMLDKTRASLTPIPKPDVDAEWKAFRDTHNKTQTAGKFHIFNLFSRNVAASIAIGLVSLAAVAAVVGVSVNYALNKKSEPQIAKVIVTAKENVATSDTIVVVEEVPDVTPETIVFDNEKLETIINRIAEYYGYREEFSTDAPRSLRLYFRWNQAQAIDEVVESLNNFEQINLTVKDKTIKIN